VSNLEKSKTPDDQGPLQLGEALAQAGLPASDLARKAKALSEIVDAKTEALAVWVRARPITCVLIAAAIGYFIVKLRR
jgi:hypothetical protein